MDVEVDGGLAEERRGLSLKKRQTAEKWLPI